jgi:hypothetical protein
MTARDAQRKRAEDAAEDSRALYMTYSILRSAVESDAESFLHRVRQAPSTASAILAISNLPSVASSSHADQATSDIKRCRNVDPCTAVAGVSQLPRPSYFYSRPGIHRIGFR